MPDDIAAVLAELRISAAFRRLPAIDLSGVARSKSKISAPLCSLKVATVAISSFCGLSASNDCGRPFVPGNIGPEARELWVSEVRSAGEPVAMFAGQVGTDFAGFLDDVHVSAGWSSQLIMPQPSVLPNGLL